MTLSRLDKQGLTAALFTAIAWSMVGIFVRLLPEWPPFAVLAGRFLVAAGVMLPIFFLTPSARLEFIRSLRIPQIWWLSLLAIGGYALGTTAFQIAPVGEVTLLMTTSPLFVVAYKYFVGLRTKQSGGIGVLLAIVGVSFILLPQRFANEAVFWQAMPGYLLALGAAGMLALYALWLSTLTKQRNAPRSIDVVFVTCLLGSVLSLLYAVFFSRSLIELEINGSTILTMIGLGVLSTAFPSLCYTVAAQRLPAVMTTAILLLEVVFATLFASVALQETPSLWFYFGSVLVLYGLLLISREAD
ncbi:MAG: DMT family transporter [Leptolyngbyaceae cyanobacterium SM1_4_3]|nr:DMT family transporter [Leptolyngbyaceae cyanobacterium SM1_4_3]NJN89626.1 DMT family transporter [Leptolyngbyaceae cyanobacterium SL_5_14]